MAGERIGHTLQPTALVHEAYLRLVGDENVEWQNRAHFFGAAARAMRRILIDRARYHAREKRGGGREREPLDAVDVELESRSVDLVALDEALVELEKRDPRMAEIVQLRFFGGLGVEEAAASLGVSERTIKREWSVARAWLYQRLEAED